MHAFNTPKHDLVINDAPISDLQSYSRVHAQFEENLLLRLKGVSSSLSREIRTT